MIQVTFQGHGVCVPSRVYTGKGFVIQWVPNVPNENHTPDTK